MMRPKYFSLFLVLIMILATFGTAFAQEPPFCGDLAEEDCALLQSSQAAMLGVSDYQSANTMVVSVAGLPGLPAEVTEVGLALNAAWSADEAGLAAIAELASIPQSDMALATVQQPDLLIAMAAGIDAAMTANMEMTPELAQMLTAQASGVPVPDALTLDMVLLDGVFYIDLSPLASYGAYDGWVGMPLTDYLVAVKDTGYFEERAAQMDPATLAQTDPATALTLAIQNALLDPKLYESALTVERSDDVDMDGATAAVFVTTFDAATWLTSPEFAALMKSIVDSGAVSGADAAQLDQAMQMLPMFAPMLFQGLSVQEAKAVGVDNSYLYGTSFNLMWDMASLIQMAAMSGQLPEGLDPNAATAIQIRTEGMNSDFGNAQEITAPADAAMFTVEQMLGQAQ